MVLEFRVVSKREGCDVKRKVYQTRRAAERRMILYGPEPWSLAGKDPDKYFCCDGRMCGCDGMTNREESEYRRESMPKLEYARIESREAGEWIRDEPRD